MVYCHLQKPYLGKLLVLGAVEAMITFFLGLAYNTVANLAFFRSLDSFGAQHVDQRCRCKALCDKNGCWQIWQLMVGWIST